MTTKKRPEHKPIPDLSAKVKELEEKVKELTAGWQRTQADFLNYKKRTEENRNQFSKTAKTDLLIRILPILDNFRLSTQHLPKELENNNWAKGIQHIERQIEQLLADEGVEKIPAVGQEFNPAFHEAIETVESDYPENQIALELQTGYRIGDLCLRPSRVKVSKGPEPKQ